MTPSQIYGWEGLAADVDLTRQVEARMPSEEKWYALTGRVVEAKVEADGDIHIALEDATGNNVGTVSAEIPVGPRWCEIRRFDARTAFPIILSRPTLLSLLIEEAFDRFQ